MDAVDPQNTKGTPEYAARVALLTIEAGEFEAIEVQPADQRPGDIFVRHEGWAHATVLRRRATDSDR